MSDGTSPPGGLGMRDVVICDVGASPPSAGQVLDVLARVAATSGGGVASLLDAACELGAYAALIRSTAVGRTALAPAVAGSTDGDANGRQSTDDAPTERLELPLGAAPTSRGTLVLALPSGLLAARPDLRTALGRVLDETEIYRELARQLGRALPFSELLVARPAADGGRFIVGFALRGDEERPAGTVVQAGDATADVLAEVARSGRPARATDPLAADAPALVAVPMLAGLQLVGVLLVRCAAPPAPPDEEMLRAFGAQAATALVNAALYADSQRERRQTEALAEVARAVGASLRLNEVLRLILRHATALLRAEGAYVALRSGEFLEIVAAIVITDPSRHVLFANPAAEQLFGRSGGVVGLAVRDLVQPAHREAVAERQRATLAGTAQSYETIVVGAGGEFASLAFPDHATRHIAPPPRRHRPRRYRSCTRPGSRAAADGRARRGGPAGRRAAGERPAGRPGARRPRRRRAPA